MNSLHPTLDAQALHSLGILAIAQVGDAVFELMVRTRLCVAQPTAAKLHRARIQYVNAAAQAQALELLEELLTPAEQDVVRRGRNAHVTNVPKAVTPAVYGAATALEALWGYLYLSGQSDRINQLFEVIWHE